MVPQDERQKAAEAFFARSLGRPGPAVP